MKKIIMLAVISFVFCANIMAKGIPVPYCSACEYITIVADLPDSTQFYSEEYKGFMDVGYKYNQFWLVWLPLWNTNGQYCLTIKDQDVYFEVTPEELDSIAKIYNINLPTSPIPIWDKIGGKAIVLLLIGFGAWGYIGKKGKKEDEETEAKDNA